MCGCLGHFDTTTWRKYWAGQVSVRVRSGAGVGLAVWLIRLRAIILHEPGAIGATLLPVVATGRPWMLQVALHTHTHTHTRQVGRSGGNAATPNTHMLCTLTCN